MSGLVRRRLWHTARAIVAQGLMADAHRIWTKQRHDIDCAIEKVEQAWSLAHDAKAAVQLATMYDQANQNAEALVVLREAFRRYPKDPLVRHHAAITLLRHGAPGDIRDFFDSVLEIDPADAFARFTVSLLDSYDVWVGDLVSSIRGSQDGRRPLIIACPVWGQPFADNFVRYLCAALLSTNNLPRLAQRHSVHFAIFTTAETEHHLRADALFSRLTDHATVHFIRFAESQVTYAPAMEACYGQQEVFYSRRPLAYYYARNCKFVLMSCAHYAALAAGRLTDALVSCQVADTILNDGALTLIADELSGRSDAVLINSIQLDGKTARAALEKACRRPDGVIEITPADCTRIVVEHLPDYNFVTASNEPRIPLRACWRVGPDGVLMHANHYHPMGLRPTALDHPLHLATDPVDSRFIDRSSLPIERIEIIQDARIVGLSLEEGPLEEQLQQGGASLSIPDIAFWLWGYWGRLRGHLFRSPLRFGTAKAEEWAEAESRASVLVEAIVERAASFENGHQRRNSWRL